MQYTERILLWCFFIVPYSRKTNFITFFPFNRPHRPLDNRGPHFDNHWTSIILYTAIQHFTDRRHLYCIFVVSIPLCYIQFSSYTLYNTTRWMLIHFNTYFIILATCFGYVIAILRPTRTVELSLDAALSGMKHLLFASIIKFI
jgi:hypothetical protein